MIHQYEKPALQTRPAPTELMGTRAALFHLWNSAKQVETKPEPPPGPKVFARPAPETSATQPVVDIDETFVFRTDLTAPQTDTRTSKTG